MPTRPKLVLSLLFAVLIAMFGCVVYQPTSTNPADLATIESTTFPILGLQGNGSAAGTITLTVNAIDGVSRIMSPFGADIALIDAGAHEIAVRCEANTLALGGQSEARPINGTVHFRLNLLAGEAYKLAGRMAGPHLSSGIDVWIENVATGAIEHPPVHASLH